MNERTRLTLAARPAPAEGEAVATAADKTRAWQVSPARAEKLKEQARDMRRNPTEAEALLWEGLKDKKCGGFAFTRQVVMGSAIVDFACRSRWLVVETGGASEAEVARNELSDRKLTEVGVRVLRFTDEAILADVAGVLGQIAEELQKPFAKPQSASADRGNARPARPSRPAPRGGNPRDGNRGPRRFSRDAK